jgi:GTP-binding protein
VSPPTVVLHVNEPRLFDQNWRRYLENRFRDAFDFPEVPVRIDVRARKRKALSVLKAGKRRTESPDDSADDSADDIDDDIEAFEEE